MMEREKQIDEMAEEILQEYTNCYSEVDKKCLEKMLSKFASEVAAEIFAEIEKEIVSAIDNNLQRMAEQDSANEIWRICVSKKNTLCGIYDFIAELKKKYTESEGE